MAHCLLQNGQLDKAEAALCECNSLQERNPLDIGVQKGFITMVEAELLSARGRYDEANSKFSISIGLLGNSLFAPMYRSMAITMFGRSLANQRRLDEANAMFSSAIGEYERIENHLMAQRVTDLMNELACAN
jgi:tetratricopeptide (TPR) repeat protein